MFAAGLLAANSESARAAVPSYGFIHALVAQAGGACGPCEVEDYDGDCVSTCAGNEECVNDECVEPCDDPSDCECGADCESNGYCGDPKCPAGEECVDGECEKECESECPEGSECVDGKCEKECEGDADCECGAECGGDGYCGESACEGTQCVEGECQPCDDGSQCAACAECENGECVVKEERPSAPDDGCDYCEVGCTEWALDAPNACYHECSGGSPEQAEDPSNPYDGCSTPADTPAPECADGGSAGDYFDDPCMGHDACYRSNCDAGKGDCDDDFLSDMEKQCDKDFDKNKPSNPTGYDAGCYDDCVNKAQTFAGAVTVGGQEAFDEGHACCDEPGPCS